MEWFTPGENPADNLSNLNLMGAFDDLTNDLFVYKATLSTKQPL